MTMGVTVVTLFSILTVGVAVSAGPVNQTSRCEAGDFAVGENASVTCFFNTDIRQTMQDVNVTWYPYDSLDNGTNALTCKRRITKEFDCKAAEGYLFNNFISDNLTLEIPKANERFSGHYSCGLATHEGIPENTCDLKIKEAELTCQAEISTEGTTASVTCYFHKNMENSVHHLYIVRYPFNANENSTTPMVCFRLHNKKLECNTKEGYSFNGIVSHKLTLEIPEVRTRFAGRYSCQIFPPDGVPMNTCDLPVTAHPRQNSNPQTDDDEGPKDIALISVSILAMLFLCIAILVWCKQDSIRKFVRGCFTPSQTEDHRGTGNAGEEKTPCIVPENVYVEMENASPLGERETVNTISEFDVWADGLPSEAREALLKDGFDNVHSLKLVEEEDIKTLQLKRGHEKLLREKLKSANEQNVMPLTGGLQVNLDSVENVESTHLPPTVSVAEKGMVASGKEGNKRTLPEREVHDNAKLIPSPSGSSTKVVSSQTHHENLNPVPHLFLRGNVSVSRKDDGTIVAQIKDRSYLRLETASDVDVTYVDPQGKTRTFKRDHLSAEDKEVLREKLREFELSNLSRAVTTSDTPGKTTPVQGEIQAGKHATGRANECQNDDKSDNHPAGTRVKQGEARADADKQREKAKESPANTTPS